MYKLPTQGWIAKDEDGRVWLHPSKPKLTKSANGMNYWTCGSDATFIGRYIYSDRDWKDEPAFCHIRIDIQN